MNILFVMKKILRQFMRDRRTMALILIIPLIIISIFFFMLKDELSLRITLAVVSPDRETAMYAALIETMKSAENLTVIEDAGPSASQAITRTNADAALAFPAGFFSDLSANEKPHYELRIEGTKGGIESAIGKLADAAILRARLQSIPLFRGRAFSSGAVADISYHYNTRGFRTIDLMAPGFITFFLYFISFLLTCVAFLRERSSGTLERILVSPLSSVSLVLGYLLAFFIMGSAQGAFLLMFSTWVLGIKTVVGIFWALIPILVTVLLGVTMGIFFSELAKNEFQVIQFIPLVIIPQTLLSGIIFEIDALPAAFRWIARGMPLTYTNNILKGMLLRGKGVPELAAEFLILGAFLVFFTLLSFLVARRAR
jgi:ABC-2 type transport system permease protein